MNSSWYSISISLESGGLPFFNGYFVVDNNTNLVTGFYETIDNLTNFNNNILIPTGTGSPYGSYLGFTTYLNSFAVYDNAYLSNWLQFDINGVVINSMSAYPNYHEFNLWAANIGDETINNIGVTSGINIYLSTLFTITPVSDPTTNYVQNGSQLYDFLNSTDTQCIITNDIEANFNLTSSYGTKIMLTNNSVKIIKT
jgi:hypothetical protein